MHRLELRVGGDVGVGVQREACGVVTQHTADGLDVHAVLQRHRCEGVPQQMGPQAGNSGFLFQLAKQLRDGASANGIQCGRDEHLIGLGTTGPPPQIPQQHLFGAIAKGNRTLLAALAVHNGISFMNVQIVERERSHFIHAKAAVQYQGADTFA